jgi:DNA-binding NtrC family response regulator
LADERRAMTAKYQLSTRDRDFFQLVERAARANPFMEERRQANIQLSGLSDEFSELEQNQKGVETVRERFKRLEEAGRDNFNQYVVKDQRLLKNATIFDFFHCFTKHFDRHISDQLNAGAKPIKVIFRDEAFAYLHQKGYSDEEKLRAFALTFQIWRAYYFIVRNLVGRSSVMRKLRQSLWNNVFTHSIDFYIQYLWNRMEDFSTIITGETGTGKGTAAIAIGRSGFIPFDEKNSCFIESFAQSFVTLNLSQFPEALIESELFGHKKGAFTGAVDDHEGVLQRCSQYGAIFLDEIGEVSFPIQIKLLKVLEERLYSPVGSHEIHRFDGRIIAATNRAIDELVRNGLMRSDFYYRLCSDIITVAPLRDRIKDDPHELNDLLNVIVTKILGVETPEVVDQLRSLIVEQLGLDYDWPGNVRELAQCVRRLLLNQIYQVLPVAGDGRSSQFAIDLDHGNIDAQTLVRRYCNSLYRRFGTYGEVARRTKLDRRTVKKYVTDYNRDSKAQDSA